MNAQFSKNEVLISAFFPVVALLIVGVIGTRQMINSDIRLFLFSLIVCCILAFVGQVAIVHLTQQALKKQYAELVNVCQEHIAGRTSARVLVIGDTALTLLANTLNAVFDSLDHQQSTQSKVVEQYDDALLHLIQEFTPVLNGDLRIHAQVSTGNVGVLADICNALVEELRDLVKWTRHSSQKIRTDTNTLLHHSLELAQVAEAQMIRFSQTTEAVELLVAFIQRLSNNLQLIVDITQNMKGIVANLDTRKKELLSSFLPQVDEQITRQLQLLDEALKSSQSNAKTADIMITDFYAFAQRIHQSSTGILQAAEQINLLAKTADQWQKATLSFQLPHEEMEHKKWQTVDVAKYTAPTPTSPMRRVKLQSVVKSSNYIH